MPTLDEHGADRAAALTMRNERKSKESLTAKTAIHTCHTVITHNFDLSHRFHSEET